jgi:hypothetical protein
MGVGQYSSYVKMEDTNVDDKLSHAVVENHLEFIRTPNLQTAQSWMRALPDRIPFY